MRICVFEDGGIAGLDPLILTRPAFALRCGASTLLDRQKQYFDAHSVVGLVSAARTDTCRLVCPDLLLLDTEASLTEHRTLVNARWLPPAARDNVAPERGLYLAGEDVAFAVLSADDCKGRIAADLPHLLADAVHGLPCFATGGTMVRHLWDLVEQNAKALEHDALRWRASRDCARAPHGCAVIGPIEALYVDPSAHIEPHIVVDTTRGPVLIDRDAQVRAFSRLEGPCYVGPRTHLLAAHVKNASFGSDCRIGGEVECSIVQGYSNKAHDGFLGHSYVGEWVNLGAGTITSDLRTDYGPVTMQIAGKHVETGLLKVGAFLGDHVKTSIGTLFNTGTTVGPFGLLLTSGTLLPRTIPSFCRYGHGRLHERTDLGQMFETAAAMLSRRGQQWTDAHADVFHDLYEQTAATRHQSLREGEQRRLRRVV